MTDESVKRILTAPVTLLRPSSEAEEQAVFHRTKGRFYTIGLKSGQSFVAQFPGQNTEDNPFSEDNFAFQLRPLKNLVPQLEGVKWIFTGLGGPQIRTLCAVTPETTEKEKLFLEDVFGSHVVKQSYWDKGFYRPHEMFVKLNNVNNQLLENERLKKALMTGQQRLQNLMIQDDNDSINQITQNLMNERRQNG